MLVAALIALTSTQSNLGYLRQVAHEVVDSAKVVSGAAIQNGGRNTTGFTLRVPGGTQTYYPAFWIRDAAMMLGADLVPAAEVEGWIRVTAKVQPGPDGMTFPHGLMIPPYSVPDHITLGGEACWFPGAYTNQGDGHYGFLPPADDAFYFIQMAWEYARLTDKRKPMETNVMTAWGDRRLSEVCIKAYDSVEANPITGLVVCSGEPGKGRVDWGFCDSVSKHGSCLMPSLLRWQAATRLSTMLGDAQGRRFRSDANLIAKSIPSTFFRPDPDGEGLLVSATELEIKDDIWASAFAVSLGVLPRRVERAVGKHLLTTVRKGGTVKLGQVRQMPPEGPFGGFWEASSGPGTYQNGGFWATPTGWLIVALSKIDRAASEKVLDDYVSYVRENRSKGAPFEWINSDTGITANGNYASSAGLVYISLSEAGFYRHVE